MAAAPQVAKDSTFQIITVTKETSLGLNIVGGINRTEGPLVYIQEVIPGGDCHKDGRLRPGDQFVSINKESLIGVSYEEAKSILTRSKLRPDSAWEIAFIRQKGTLSGGGSHQQSVSLDPLLSGSKQLAGASERLPPYEKLAPKMASTPSTLKSILPSIKPCLSKVECVKRKQAPIISADSSPPDLCTDAVAPNRTEDYGLPGRKISLNPTVRLKVEKLEMALNYLGVKPTEEQHKSLRQELQIDSNDTVSFGDFVQVARNVFHLQLNEVGIGQGPMVFGVNEIANLLDSPTSQLQPCDSLQPTEIERLAMEKNDTFKEIDELKKQLCESESQRKLLSEELQNVKQEAKAAVEETKALRSRVHLAEAAQRQAQGMEMDYEEVIHLLEAEITELKAQTADHSGQNKDSMQDLRKRITVLDCQLRKSEMARKTFEVSTEKLLQFVEVVHEVLSDNSASLSNIRPTLWLGGSLHSRWNQVLYQPCDTNDILDPSCDQCIEHVLF
ncbi:syntaxin-binding protein 4 isoform X1 [Rhinatrema bivittatum]|uniref:syntaxin-binding protein 4 isoform X1 n=1 Tax=Rhinatrema bivittatum TaxID=194408 RepID=UPI001127DD4A|nr:syntaxin-binding protein 4 isoform X1 [Rhinatrema bivittatum]